MKQLYLAILLTFVLSLSAQACPASGDSEEKGSSDDSRITKMCPAGDDGGESTDPRSL